MTKCNILVRIGTERRPECYGKGIQAFEQTGTRYDSCV